MDILDGGVVHTTGTAGFRIQSAFKHGSEDGGADERPIEIVAGTLQNQVPNLFRDAGNLYIRSFAPLRMTAGGAKKAAVDIGESQQFLILVGVAVFRFGVEDAEEFDKFFSEFAGAELLHIIMEHVLASEDAGIFRI